MLISMFCFNDCRETKCNKSVVFRKTSVLVIKYRTCLCIAFLNKKSLIEYAVEGS
jgi:hypothetical protein